jgi:hypothetical protein
LYKEKIVRDIAKDIAAGIALLALLVVVILLSSCAAFQNKVVMEPVIENVCAIACDSAEKFTSEQCNDACSEAGDKLAETCYMACSIAVDVASNKCDKVCSEKLYYALKKNEINIQNH